jgi:hypothetical protein
MLTPEKLSKSAGYCGRHVVVEKQSHATEDCSVKGLFKFHCVPNRRN